MMWGLSRRQKLIRCLLQTLGLDHDRRALARWDQEFAAAASPLDLTAGVLLSVDGLEAFSQRTVEQHLYRIHSARLKLVRHLLPPASQILDLGGANCPLHKMGYRHPFERLVVIDLPAGERHEAFREVELSAHLGGKVVARYQDMTELAGIADNSIDLVWSGQSIEHVSPEAGARMCQEAVRVLRPGGHFCLDTPNRLVTALHTATVGGGFIHPDHRIEYTPAELRRLLEASGLEIEAAWGICGMPLSVASGSFTYQDFLIGGAITSDIDGAYIQYFHCRKPAAAR